VGEDGGDSEAAGAFYVHKEASWGRNQCLRLLGFGLPEEMRDMDLEFVLFGLSGGRGIKKVEC
jgi:hypothetical protein